MVALRSVTVGLLIFCAVASALAENCSAQTVAQPPKSGFSVLNPFKGRDAKLFDKKVIDVTDFWNQVHKKEEANIPPANESALDKEKKKIVFVGDDPQKHTAPPGEDVPVRLNKEAPGPFIDMALANRSGDKALASSYADQYVRYLVNLMYEVRELTSLIGAALVRQGAIDEESWVGVEQYVDYEFAKARNETASPLKPTHEESLKRIVADPNHQAEVYYFFTLNCSYCRKMAPDVERLWRIAKADPRVKMAALTLGPQPKAWVESYRQYTGLTIDIFNGAEVAKQFKVAFVPAIVIVSPTTGKAYLKTGEQNFARLHEFLRTVQGLPTTISPQLQKFVNVPIGEVETARANGRGLYWEDGNRGEVKFQKASGKVFVQDSIGKF